MDEQYINLIKTALLDFRRNKARTILTSLGIMIGVLSVVLLIGLGLGLRNYIQETFESLGANLIIVFPGNVFTDQAGFGGGFGPGLSGGASFDEKDADNLRRSSGADLVVPVYFKSSLIKTKDTEYLGNIQGTSEESFDIWNLDLLAGQAFTKSDVNSKAKVAVIGEPVADKLFGGSDNAVGQTIRLDEQRYKVLGVFKKTGDREQDNSALVPYKTTFGSINPDKTFFAIYLGVHSDDLVPQVKQEAEDILLKRYNEDDFSVVEQTEILSTINEVFSVINAVLVAIGSISLIVGGVGIMNIMYATVTERTKEVGIRRAIGATQQDILSQFLVESTILSLLGGLAGLLLASAIVLIVHRFFPAEINIWSVLIALGVSSVIGVFFGVFPARRAAKLPPIEAIRYE